MNGKIKYIVVLLILGIYILAMFFFFGKPEEKKEEPYLYILAGPDTRWTYQGGGWGRVINDVSYNMKPFRVYIDNKDKGAYNVTFNEKFYFFDSERKSQRFEGDVLAIRGNIAVDVLSFEPMKVESDEDVEFVKKLLDRNKLDTPLEKVSAWKSSADLDGDGKTEHIYTVDNVFETDAGTYAFAFIVVTDGKSLEYLYSNIRPAVETLDMCKPSVKNIIDINQDKQYEIITSCQNYGNSGTCNNLYDTKKNEYKLLKNC